MSNSARAPRGIDLFIRLVGLIIIIIGLLIIYSTLTSVTVIGEATLLFVAVGTIVTVAGIITTFAKIE
jgi:predicted transcriptional regulator